MVIPSAEYHRTDVSAPKKVTSGLDAVVDRMVGRWRCRGSILRSLRRAAEQIEARADDWRGLTDRALKERLAEFRDLFHRGARDCEDRVPEALAAIREAADRQLGLRPFTVQLMGALALRRGLLAEMATGEGKTLVAGLASVLGGWSGKPCHIITVNDYLAARDADWMRGLYEFCGVSVGHVVGLTEPLARRRAYGRDVTYTTSKEIVADFLRDRLRLGPLRNASERQIRRFLEPHRPVFDGVVMRGLHTAIVDEADSVLIDEAVTPLIISAANANQLMQDAYLQARALASGLEPGVHYAVSPRYREVELKDAGKLRIADESRQLPGLWRGRQRREELVQQALTARELFHPEKHYVVQDGKVVIVDEFTGRIMPMRTWNQGLHQAIEAKEDLEISAPTETLARLSFQRFFRFFRRLSGMTGTAREASAELWHIYRLPVVPVPTNEPCIRTHHPDRVFAAERAKWDAVVEEIQRVHGTGRPLLIGTRSVRASEELARRLEAEGLEFQLLNAVRHREEAAIIAEAGKRGRITIATNMAGRGTDILLEDGVPGLGGLHVIATERHESARIDRQLFGRSGRQGDPGSAQAFVSLEDELVTRFIPSAVRKRVASALAHGVPGARPMAGKCFGLAQLRAQRQAYRQRCAVLRADTWLEESLSFTGRDLG